jgi:hypothetical protein
MHKRLETLSAVILFVAGIGRPGMALPATEQASVTAASNREMTYINSNLGISMHYTSDFKQVEGLDGQLFDDLDVPFNRAMPIATFIYAASKYGGTTFKRAGIAIFKIQPSSLGCRTIGLGTATNAQGVTYYHGVATGSVGTLTKKDSFYLVPHTSDCYDVIARITTDSSISKTLFADSDRAELVAVMDKLSLTLTTVPMPR